MILLWRTVLRYGIPAVGAATIAAFTTNHFTKDTKMPLVHELKFPLVLAGAGPANQTYLLPAGTSLYYDQAFPEGFVRYKVYVNVEGVKLESREATEKFWLNPLTAFPVDAEQLPKLLRDHPISKEDLAAILKSGVISKADIRALLEEYSR
ncbi:hypothetical protein ACVNIS_16860 [Sphaerotilaceae bacterium SBD11-9]